MKNIPLNRNKVNLYLTVLLILLTTWLIFRSKAPEPLQTSTTTNTPEFIIEGASHIQMNKQGTPKHRLEVASAIHYGKHGVSHMVKPKITSLTPEDQWYAEAEYGKTSNQHEQNKLTLKDNVIVKKLSPNQLNTEPKLTTSELTIWPDKMIAETIKPVTIHQGQHQLSAVGMYADLKLKQVEFHSEVKGHYAKNTPSKTP